MSASVDWNSLEAKFQELHGLLNAPSYGLNASLARQQQREQVQKAMETLLEMAQAESRRLLVEGNAQAAVEGGLRTLKLKELYYGNNSLQLVPAYFHLARTNQYLDKFKQAEEFLSLAQWIILRHPDSDVALKAELQQTFGLLYASDGKLDIALKQLAQATYYLTVLNGPDHILTSFGYFDLGNVFAAKGSMDSAMAFYEKVKTVWFTHLESCFTPVDEESEEEDPVEHRDPSSFGEENLQDGLKMVRGIVGLQTERFGLVHPSTGRAELVLALFHQWLGDPDRAQECFQRTYEIHRRVYGGQHTNTTKIAGYMAQFGYKESSLGALDETPAQQHALPPLEGESQPQKSQPSLPPPQHPQEDATPAAPLPSEPEPQPATQPEAAEEGAQPEPGEGDTAAQGGSEGAAGEGSAEGTGEAGTGEEREPVPEEA